MKRALFYSLIILALATCLYLLFNKSRQRSNSAPQNGNSQSVSNGETISQSTPVASIPTMPQQASQSKYPAPAESRQQSVESLRAVVNTWSNQIQRPIEFYGKVIDENTQPVEAASISFSCNQHLSETSLETNATSDANGLFSISGLLGSTLSVQVGKEGYYSVKSNSYQFDYRAILNTSAFQPDPNNPVIFHLRKKGAGADLITSKNGVSPYLTIAAPKDGQPIWADLTECKAGSSGQLEIQSWLDTDPDTHRTKSWRLRLFIPNGGFVQVQDEFPFEAPESGYQSELDFPQPDSSGNVRFGVSQKLYYIAFGNPRLYGRLEVNASDQTGEVWFQYTINPNGSRNLEPK